MLALDPASHKQSALSSPRYSNLHLQPLAGCNEHSFRNLPLDEQFKVVYELVDVFDMTH
jgi:hypothetical protein